MTYCVERTKLMSQAGRTLAEMLLPKPFRLWYSDHDTGCQMTIVTASKPTLTVWMGSIWYSSIYEFNDEGDTPGLQPDFAFAQPVIDQYFDDLRIAVEQRKAERAAVVERRQMVDEEQKRHVINAVLDQLAPPADKTKADE